MNQYTDSLTVLFVEENRTTQLLYQEIFEDIVDNMIFANDGKDGFEKNLDNKIDIIFTDYNMPNSNGLELIKKIRKTNKDIPIILVTAIDDITIVINSLQLSINNFVRKPIKNEDIINAFDTAYKLFIANKFIKEQNNIEKQKINQLQSQHKYNTYQENLSFSKELVILRNDFYYQMTALSDKSVSLIDFLYQPLDVMSGDAYSARKIDEFQTFYLIVDGMGKGLSASLSAMIMTSFVNHILDKMLETDHFDLYILIHETLKYIQKILLDEESLSIDYIVIDNTDSMIYYSKFSMPVTLMQNSKDEIIRLKSNNGSMNRYQDDFIISSYDISDIDKFLFYSDGIVENDTLHDNRPYSDFIEEDFKNSLTKKEFTDKMFQKLSTQEDDFTLAFINRLHFNKETHIDSKVFNSSLGEIDNANEWYTKILNSLCSNTVVLNSAEVVFSELYMNAYEHGNLAISADTKHSLLNDDIYFDTLVQKEKECSKKITVDVKIIHNSSYAYIVTIISDEGIGFDTQILSEIFRNSEKFNGRGVFVSRKNSMGIYYNSKGNKVLYLNKMENYIPASY